MANYGIFIYTYYKKKTVLTSWLARTVFYSNLIFPLLTLLPSRLMSLVWRIRGRTSSCHYWCSTRLSIPTTGNRSTSLTIYATWSPPLHLLHHNIYLLLKFLHIKQLLLIKAANTFWFTKNILLRTFSLLRIILTFSRPVIHFRNISMPVFTENALIRSPAIYFFHRHLIMSLNTSCTSKIWC